MCKKEPPQQNISYVGPAVLAQQRPSFSAMTLPGEAVGGTPDATQPAPAALTPVCVGGGGWVGVCVRAFVLAHDHSRQYSQRRRFRHVCTPACTAAAGIRGRFLPACELGLAVCEGCVCRARVGQVAALALRV